MPFEDVDFDLPGSTTAVEAFRQAFKRTKAVEFTDDVGKVRYVGDAFNFRVEAPNGVSNLLAATVVSDAELDIDTGPTLTVTGLACGTVTINPRERTLLLPLFF